MLGMGWQEILLIMVLAVVVVGPDRLPEMMRFLGRQYGKLRRASDELRRAFLLEADRADAEKRAEELRRRREEARQRADEIRRRALEAKGGQPDISDLPDGGPARPTDPGLARRPQPEAPPAAGEEPRE
jgi:sec-independent protein translocase protein TatB